MLRSHIRTRTGRERSVILILSVVAHILIGLHFFFWKGMNTESQIGDQAVPED